MSATPATPRDVAGEPGYLMLLRGQPFAGYNNAKHGPLWNYRLLPGRAGDAGALIFHLVYDRTWSALGCKEWAKITLQEFCEYFPHKSARAIRHTLKFLVSIHLIERDPEDIWRFKTRPDNVASAPLLIPVRHPNAAAKKREGRAARLSVRTSTAAFRNGSAVHDQRLPDSGPIEPTGEHDPMGALFGPGRTFVSAAPIPREPDFRAELKPVSPNAEGRIAGVMPACVDPATVGGDPAGQSTDGLGSQRLEEFVNAPLLSGSVPSVKHISTSDDASQLKLVSLGLKPITEMLQPVSRSGAMNVAPDETYCHWNWACPFLNNDLDGHKPLIQISQSLQAGQSDVVLEDSADRPASWDEVEQIRQLLLSELSDRLPGDHPSDVLCQRIHSALAGCPLEMTSERSKGISLLRHRIRERYHSINSYGIVEHIAGDVGKFWRDHKVKDRQREQEQRLRTGNRLIQTVKDSFRDLNQSFRDLQGLVYGRGGGPGAYEGVRTPPWSS